MDSSLLQLLAICVGEIRRHNDAYHYRTPPSVVEQLERVLDEPLTEEQLKDIVERCRVELSESRPTPTEVTE